MSSCYATNAYKTYCSGGNGVGKNVPMTCPSLCANISIVNVKGGIYTGNVKQRVDCKNGHITGTTPIPTKSCKITAPVNGSVGADCSKELADGKSCIPDCDKDFTVSGKYVCTNGTLSQTASCKK